MSNGKGLVCLLCAALFLGTTFAVTPDRIAGDLTGPKVPLKGNVHGLAHAESDLGRADSNRLIEGISLAFRPSPAQQKDLDTLISQLADPKSPNYHKYLTPAQFGERFGLSLNDIARVSTWLQHLGFTNIHVSNGRNQISFDGTIGQVESAFDLEMHNYAVDGVVHQANAGEPSIPAALSGMVIGVNSLNDFAPKPRAKVRSHLTSYVSGNHFLTPADFATIYDLNQLYAAGIDGTGQTIAVVGQSTVSTTDLNNFRTASGLAASTVTMTLSGGTSTKCSGGDERESELDIEWSGGVAKGAKIIFVYAGVGSGGCSSRPVVNSVWGALQYAVDHNVAPFISTSYGFCESGLGNSFALSVQGWAKQAILQGQTIVAASGDAGAADCESSTSTSATTGYAVDVPASIPEVTGAGGTEFTGDTQASVSGTAPNTTAASDPPYWAGSKTGSDAISTALEYIPEMAWNDTTQSITGNPPGGLSASGGGASIYFAKPTWQTGNGVPADGKRDVPDISMNASNFNDPYLICTEDGDSTPCASGFRDSAGGNFYAVGGTSASAPTFSAILALVNQYIGSTGVAPVNPTLYSLAASNPSVFHDVTVGDNKVPCTSGTTSCPAGTTSIGFSTEGGPGYDQVTGLGSVDAFVLAQALAPFNLSAGPFGPASVAAGASAVTTITVTPNNSFTGTVTFSCSGLPAGANCTFSPNSVTGGSGATQLTFLSAPNSAPGSTSVVVKGSSGTAAIATNANLNLTATTESFSLVPNPSVASLSVAQGQTSGAISLNVTSSSTPSFVNINGSGSSTVVPVSYTCVNLPSESACNFSPATTTSATSLSFTVTTTAPTAKLLRPLGKSTKLFYAVLLPSFLGIVFTPISNKRSNTRHRAIMLIALLGFTTMWAASCGGTSSSSSKNPGTPTGSYKVTVNATTGGAAPLTSSLQFTLNVTP